MRLAGSWSAGMAPTAFHCCIVLATAVATDRTKLPLTAAVGGCNAANESAPRSDEGVRGQKAHHPPMRWALRVGCWALGVGVEGRCCGRTRAPLRLPSLESTDPNMDQPLAFVSHT